MATLRFAIQSVCLYLARLGLTINLWGQRSRGFSLHSGIHFFSTRLSTLRMRTVRIMTDNVITIIYVTDMDRRVHSESPT